MDDRTDEEPVGREGSDQTAPAPAGETNDIAPVPSEGRLPITPPPSDDQPIDGVNEIEVSSKQGRFRIIGLSTKSNIYVAAMVATPIELALPNPDWLKAAGLAVTALFAVLAARRRRE